MRKKTNHAFALVYVTLIVVIVIRLHFFASMRSHFHLVDVRCMIWKPVEPKSFVKQPNQKRKKQRKEERKMENERKSTAFIIMNIVDSEKKEFRPAYLPVTDKNQSTASFLTELNKKKDGWIDSG